MIKIIITLSYKQKPYLTKPTRKGYSGLKPLACFHPPAKARGLSTAVRVSIYQAVSKHFLNFSLVHAFVMANVDGSGVG
jgi:hypothetical protein